VEFLQAQNPDELSIVENETLEVLAGADYDAGEGWLRARNPRGEQGFVPQNYLDYPQDQQVYWLEERLFIFNDFLY